MRTVLFSSNLGDITINVALINNLNATTDPTVNDDSGDGYEPGSLWVNKSGQAVWACVDATPGAAIWISLGIGAGLINQGAPHAATVSATLAAADIIGGLITVLQGAGAASAQQLPLATALDTALPEAGVNDAFDFSVINISTTAAESASITTNTGWTLVGDMDVAANSAATTKSAGRFRARKTAAGAWTLYRLS